MNDDARVMASPQGGFSVVEAVVALALLAIVLALTATALNASRQSLRRVMGHDGAAGFVASMRFAEQRLADAQPLYASRVGNEATIHFTGESDRMAFLAAIEGGELAGGIYRVELGRIGTAARGLMLRVKPYAPNQRAETPPEEERVIDPAVSHFAIRYFGVDSSDGTASWQETWRERNEFPLAIHIKAWKGGKPAGEIYVPLRSGRRALLIR